MKTKKCESLYPKCSSESIEWEARASADDVIYQPGICRDCGYEFKEYYEYAETEYGG